MPITQAESAHRDLLAVLSERIRRNGPMRVDEFMRACAGDPLCGYHQKLHSIGAAGDFVTAPEISQVFGELIGLWCAVTWEAMGKPEPVRLVELGPGRGTLMRDALRAAQIVPGFLGAASVHLVEISDPLRRVQQETLRSGDRGHDPPVSWHGTMAEVPAGTAVVIANEFLDALPVRQFVHDGQVWRERVVALGRDGSLQFATGDAVELSSATAPPRDAILELRPSEDDVLAALAARTAPQLSLFIDYGPGEASYGDTLQAVRGHAYVDPLEAPGAADLTAHVQFGPLAAKARAQGLAADGPMTQAEFLGRLGAVERTARLMIANPARAGAIEAATQRLLSPGGMGQLFKTMVVRSLDAPTPPPFG
jgi:NADH dehydrogenase [ubiquinone] 1 alpha subcomplex assembly factor 7